MRQVISRFACCAIVWPFFARLRPSSPFGINIYKLPRTVLLLALSLLLAPPLQAQSALDGFDPNANGDVLAVVIQPDGKILIGGGFTTLSPNGGAAVTRNHIARLNPDGTLDTAFDPNANDIVFSITLADGKILVGGFFNGANSIGGQTRNHIARLDVTTGLADSFNPNANDAVFAIAVQADGKILVGGKFNGANSIGGQARNRIARLDATTGLADSFNPNANEAVPAIAVQADGKILTGGNFTSIGGQERFFIARLDPNTGLADSFNPNALGEVRCLAVQADGKILAGGFFLSIGGQERNYIARLDATTGLADSFNPNANSNVYSIAVQADGKILAGGYFNGANSIGGQTRNRIARLDPTTGLADSFNPNANSVVESIVVQPDGRILAGGGFTSIGGQTRNHIARLDATTGLADSFDPNANSFVESIAVQADGKILAGGSFAGANSIGGQTRNRIARLDATTGLADSFDPNANGSVAAIAVQADGKILAGGGFFKIGGQRRNYIARLDATTGLADSFDPSANNDVNAIAVQADGKILAGGGFSGIGGQPRNNIARLDATTGLADSFNPKKHGVIGDVYSIAVQADGKILAGGGFTFDGGQSRNYVDRLETDGRLDQALFLSTVSTLGTHVVATAVQPDGKILIGGRFTTVLDVARNNIARLNTTGRTTGPKRQK
jgi:uncharacterized delta-60 repeat protein